MLLFLSRFSTGFRSLILYLALDHQNELILFLVKCRWSGYRPFLGGVMQTGQHGSRGVGQGRKVGRFAFFPSSNSRTDVYAG